MPGPRSQEKSDSRETARLRVEVEGLKKTIEQLSALGLDIASNLESDSVLRRVVEAACDLTDATYGALAVFGEDGSVSQFITAGLTDDEASRIGDPPRGLGVLGWLHELDAPARLADLATHPRSVGFPEHHPPMKSFLGAPIRLGDELIGNLYLTEKRAEPEATGEFTEEDENLLTLFVSQAALAIHNARVLSAERLARARAEDARQRLQTVVDTSLAGIFVVDRKTRKVVLANCEVARIVNLDSDEAQDLSAYDTAVVYLRPDGRRYEPSELPLQRALDRGEKVRAEEVIFERRDGSRISTLVNASPVYGANGDVTSAIAVIQDMTPLEEIERLRSEFLGLVSHELKTPLTAIKGAAATILGSDRPLDDADVMDLMEIVDDQSGRLRDLIDNLLDISRIEAGALSVRAISTDLREVIEDALTVFSRASGGRTVTVTAPGGLPQVRADRRRIAQVIGNLLGNAAKFSPDDSPITLAVEDDGAVVTIKIIDTGRGIPKEALPHVFKKFFQVDGIRDGIRDGIGDGIEGGGGGGGSGTRHRLSGSGLGLAICKGIVEAHGGRVWADSPGEGEGAAIGFTLLIADEADEPKPSGSTPARPIAEAPGQKVQRTGTKLKIIALDDEP